MKAISTPSKNFSARLIAPTTVYAFGAALCASFAVGSADAAPIAVDILDVTLGTFVLDINGDTIPEYTFQHSTFFPFNAQNDVTTFANKVVGFVVPPSAFGETKTGTYASALAAGELIDAGTLPGYVMGTDVILSGKDTVFPPDGSPFPVPYGQFFESGLAYVGLQFDIPDGTHFGWVAATGGDEDNLTITAYGYECAPNVGILAGAGTVGASCPAAAVPEPGSLALLIAGAAGVLAMRRRQRSRA